MRRSGSTYPALFLAVLFLWWMADTTRAVERATLDLVAIPGGVFIIGDANGEPDETPGKISVAAFSMMRHEVTNAQFKTFIDATGHITDPERRGTGNVWTDQWHQIKGADWRHPQGPHSTIAAKDTHPVVQVSARDGEAFCRWHRLRLPSEAEWEFAARGTDQRIYPWGNDAPVQTGIGRANFGTIACCAPDAGDGFARTAPVGRYGRGISPFGLHDMAGNVWEWTSGRYSKKNTWRTIRGGGWGNNPYCLRVSYRHGNPPDIGLDMVGFRCAG